MTRLLQPFAPILDTLRDVPRATADLLRLRSLRQLWRHDRHRFWAVMGWAAYGDATLLWWVWLWSR